MGLSGSSVANNIELIIDGYDLSKDVRVGTEFVYNREDRSIYDSNQQGQVIRRNNNDKTGVLTIVIALETSSTFRLIDLSSTGKEFAFSLSRRVKISDGSTKRVNAIGYGVMNRFNNLGHIDEGSYESLTANCRDVEVMAE